MALHLIQVVQPPQYMIQRIEQCMARFFWGSYGDQRHTHWVSWERICRPIAEGGLGLRRLSDVVQCYTHKLWFRFREQGSLWARFLLQKYCRFQFPGSVPVSPHSSSVWKRMCSVRLEVQSQLFWRLGVGDVSFWYDHWIGDGPLADSVSVRRLASALVQWFWSDGIWDRAKLLRVVSPEVVDRICLVPIRVASLDLIRWKSSSDGKFSFASVWASIRLQHPPCPILSLFWTPCLTPTTSIFLWRLVLNRLPVDQKLQSRGISLASKCWCCPNQSPLRASSPFSALVVFSPPSSAVESIEHIFFLSSVARRVWEHFYEIFGFTPPHTVHIPQILHYWRLFASHTLTRCTHITTIVPCLILWFLWTARNDSKHRGIFVRSDTIIYRVVRQVRLLHHCRLLSSESWMGLFHVAASLGLFYSSSPPRPPPLPIVWLPPDPGWVKLNTDGAFRMSTLDSGMGGVVRDHHGEVLFAFHEHGSVSSSISVELAALLSGLSHTIRLGHTRMWIEVDALLVVQLLSHSDAGHWSIQGFLTSIRNVLSSVEFRISHVHREGNTVADALANLGCQTEVARSFPPAVLPRQILTLARLDQMGWPSFRQRR